MLGWLASNVYKTNQMAGDIPLWPLCLPCFTLLSGRHQLHHPWPKTQKAVLNISERLFAFSLVLQTEGLFHWLYHVEFLPSEELYFHGFAVASAAAPADGLFDFL